MVQWVKSQLYKNEDLSSNPGIHVKLDGVVLICNPIDPL